MLRALLILLMVHDQGAVFRGDVIRISVTLNINRRWANEEWALINQ
jgi:hypothetical protein